MVISGMAAVVRGLTANPAMVAAGGEPKETVVERRRTTHHPLSHTATDALSRASTEALLLELRRRIIAPRDRRLNTWDDWGGGLDPHGDWPEQG